MPVAPIVERQVQANRIPVNPLSLPDNYGRYIPQTGLQDLSQVGDKLALQAKERGDNVALVEAQRKLDDWEASNLFDPTNGALNKKGKDAFGLPDRLSGDFDKYGQEIFDGLANDDQKAQFKKMWYGRLDNMRKTLYGHERSEMDAYAKSNNAALQSSSANRAALYYNVPSVVDQSITDARVAARSQAQMDGLSDEAIAQAELDAESTVRLGTLSRMADADPSAAVAFYRSNAARFNSADLLKAQALMAPTERKYKAANTATKVINEFQPKQTSGSMIDYVMTDLEGGDKVVIDNDGGTAKFGINSKGNGMSPLEVEQLTPDQAHMIYKNKYWDALNIDDLPADMRLVAFDAGVQHGVDDHTKQMIADAQGDPRRLIDIRRAYYIQLAKQNPAKNGPHLEGWMNRLAKLSAQVDLARGQEPPLAEINAKIDAETDDIEVAADAKKLIKDQREAAAADLKRVYDAANDEAANYVVNGQSVPASVEARMKPDELIKMREMQNKGMEPDPVVYNQIRDLALTGQPIIGPDGKPVSLSSLRWVLGNKYNEIAGIMSDPAKQINARSMDEIMKSANGRIIGKSTPNSTGDYQKLEQFRQIVQSDVDAMQKMTGKPATPEDIQKIVDRKLLRVGTGAFTTKNLFEVKPGGYTVDGVPNDGIHVMRGRDGKPIEIGYDQMVSDLITIAQNRGLPLNSDTLGDLYNRVIKSGQLARKYE